MYKCIGQKSGGRSVSGLTTSEIFIFEDRYNRRAARSIFETLRLYNRCRVPKAARTIYCNLSMRLLRRFQQRF